MNLDTELMFIKVEANVYSLAGRLDTVVWIRPSNILRFEQLGGETKVIMADGFEFWTKAQPHDILGIVRGVDIHE